MSAGEGLGKRIRIIRDTMSVAEFCRILDIHRNTLPNYESGDRSPDATVIINICSHFKISPLWLLFGNGPKYMDAQQGERADPSAFDYIPMVEARLSAGGGAFVESEGVKGYYAFRKDWLRRVATSTRDLVLMRVIGDSMSPTIQRNDTVMVDTGRKDIREGDIYAIRYDSTIMIKRLVFRPGEKILVVSDNKQEYDPYEVATKDLHIIGQVIFFSRVLVPEEGGIFVDLK